MNENYREFFCRITARESILPYQERYAANPFSPTLMIIPTGLGKTDTVLVPWLYRQRYGHPGTPTRLVFVLPRQNLTAQVAEVARGRVEAAGLVQVRVLELMGGSEDNRENLQPDEPAIIVATQDLYFSRALNRGYARRPPRWPIDFALYNQDCLIVLDEIQLMDDALATSTQLAAFRERFGTFGVAPSVWMSATVNRDWLRTYDFRDLPSEIRLEPDDLQHPLVQQRLQAVKSIHASPDSCRSPEGCATFVLQRHKPRTRSLVITNTVQRAREVFLAIRPMRPDAILLHSRFRPADRNRTFQSLQAIPEEGQIVVATQVLEAGVDIDASLLVTDVAPWGSMVQRFGRVNRYGELASSEICWVQSPISSKHKDPASPYATADVERAIERLRKLTSASPAVLSAIPEDGPEPWQHVLRRSDLLDLFDTTPDLSGNEIDVSRFIRATEDKDIYIAWRETTGIQDENAPEFADDELCPAPIGEVREFSKRHALWTWNYVQELWEPVDKDRIYPGMRAVAGCDEGGYEAELGWAPESRRRVDPVVPMTDPVEGDRSDDLSFRTYRQLLRDHSQRVFEETDELLKRLRIPDEFAAALRTAALKHDWGKAHPCFQETLHRQDPSSDILAKQIGHGRHKRPHLRHELASALAALHDGDSDLVAYLVAAHHGRVRMNIRSMPGEQQDGGVRTARGIREGERLPALELAPGQWKPEIELTLGVMEFGAEGGSWADRMLRLRDKVGPFRLAYLEMLLRAADQKASDNPRLEALEGTICGP
jgi:CRISPR-associated endonuclease/helicase Cas3